MTNKGVSSDAFLLVILAIIAVISIIFIFPLIREMGNVSEDLSNYHICRDGNIASVKSRVKLFDWVVAEQGVKHCRTERVNVPTGKEFETISKKMVQCWDMYLNGKEEIFQTQDANYCAFCSVLEFDDKGKSLNGLTGYLADNYVPATGEKYLQYLTEIEVTNNNKKEFYNFDLQNKLPFDTSKNLAVMFVMYKDAYPTSITNGQIISQPSVLTAWGGTAVAATATFIVNGISYVAGLGLCSTLVGCGAGIILVGTAGGLTGYLIGSDRSADWRAKLLVTEYDKQKLEQLKCTQLEGLDYLKIQKK